MGNGRRTVSDNLGAMIKYLREKKGLSLQVLAEKASVSASYLNRIENGERKRPSSIIMEDIANALEVDVVDFLEVSSSREGRDIVSLEQLLLGHDFSLNNNQVVHSKAKVSLLNLVDTIFEVKWEKDSMVEDIYDILQLVNELKAELS